MSNKDINQFFTLLKKTDKVNDNSWKVTTAKRGTLTIPEGFQVYDTDLNAWFFGDGSTVGGVEIVDTDSVASAITVDGGNSEPAIRIGDWVASQASGSGVILTSGMDYYGDGQIDVVSVFCEESGDLTSAYSAKAGRFRHMVTCAADTVINQETYGLIGQLIVKNGSLNHYHAGLMGTLETSTDCDIQTGYGVGCVCARFGGTGLTVESGGLMAGFLSVLNASTFTATGNMAAFATKKTLLASTATWPIGIYMQPSSVKQILVAGASGDPVVDDTASTKFIQVYTDCGATSGTCCGMYLRNYLTGAGGSNAVMRIYSDVVDVAAATAQGMQCSLGFGESTSTGSVTGLGVAGRFQIGLADIAYPGTGTLAVVQSEIYSFGDSSDPSGNKIAMFRVVNDGTTNGKTAVDDDAVLFDFYAGWTSADGNMLATKAAGACPNVVRSIRIRLEDGSLGYLYVGADPLTA